MSHTERTNCEAREIAVRLIADLGDHPGSLKMRGEACE